jgi:hypothetical protein
MEEMSLTDILETLTQSEYASVRYRAHRELLGEDPASPQMRRLQDSIPQDAFIRHMLSERGADGHIPRKPYHKWNGAHWVLVALADQAYPPGDEGLAPLREQMMDYVLEDYHKNYMPGRFIAGRMRMHPSIEGNLVYALIKLGLADKRVDHLVQLMLSWRWPDGGWNCDRKPEASISSFHETLIPLRALACYRCYTNDDSLTPVIAEVAEVFLKRRMFRRLKTGNVMDPKFVKLHYPGYWHYDFLFGLKVLNEAGLLHDPRTAEALDLLESKRLPDGGFPAEDRYYRTSGSSTGLGHSLADWGGVDKNKMNPWITLDALSVLKAAGRY